MPVVQILLFGFALSTEVIDTRIAVLDQGKIASEGAPVEALSTQVLKSVFGLKARWVEAGDQTLLAADRA